MTRLRREAWRGRRLGAGLYAVAFALAAVGLCFMARKGVETDVWALIGSADRARAGALAAAVRAEARFLVPAASQGEAERKLDALGVPRGAVATGAGRGLAALKPLAGALLSDETRALLERGAYAAVRDAALARLCSPAPPLAGVRDDPFLLLTDYVTGFAPKTSGVRLVTRTLTPDEALAALRIVRARAPEIAVSGAPFHAALAAEHSRREINVFGIVSIVVALGLGLWLFGGFGFVPHLLMAVASAGVFATASVFACFAEPHLVTFVFGTTLVGLGVDYVYHARAAASAAIVAPLTRALASTVCCFAPLLLSDVGVLNQMALFTISGLVAIYVFACVFSPR